MKGFGFFNIIKDELDVVEKELHKVVRTNDPLLTETSAHLLNAGGKRLRPAFALVAGKTCARPSDKLIPLATALELIHMASLVHDDVIDDSYTRRGIPTVKASWGDQVSIYTGTYLFAQSLVLIARCDHPVISRILADISAMMCEGEIQQIVTTFDSQQTVKDYFFRIKRKTALLISASCELGAIACEAPMYHVRALKRYGHYLGMAFQITDDILDFTASAQDLGKPVGSDLRQGIVTLPAIYALLWSDERTRLAEIIRKKEKKEGEVLEAIKIIKECGAIDKAIELSDRYLAKAKKQLEYLPAGRATNSLRTIADFIGRRRF
ncbi:polyprenyl synthetase family protein [Phosphitispora fastidiosa]|uniref:polyprenyl synthetase family protein n=1 Tax=Phosphitispora fastidiosa TaxID=2837202 RepID=UPI001E3E3AC3|nr:polyprenyl synthetase family protein [Phosphitispora fastidiosa]MBU7006702.1 heptaprenyl diphosphate synthase [Phosphitispora fastidiosa]